MAQGGDCCFIGRGRVYASDALGACSWGCNWGLDWGGVDGSIVAGRYLGNVSRLSITTQSQQLTTVRGAGYYPMSECSAILVQSVSIAMTLSCFSSKNLAQAFYGSISQDATLTPVVDEPVLSSSQDGSYYSDDLIPFKKLGVNTSSIVIKRSDTLALYTLGTDYAVSATGIILLTNISLPLGVTLLVSYTYSGTSERIYAFNSPSKAMRLTFDGFNAADIDMSPIRVEIHNVVLQPASELNLIGEDFATLELTGIVQKTGSNPTDPFGQYFTIERTV